MIAGLLQEQASPEVSRRVPLEAWAPARQSCIWRFNALYWQALAHWEQATGREYEQALPGGQSDARNAAAARDLILELFKVWDDLDARGALPGELYVVELGVGNGSQARTWLDEFEALSTAHSRDYYRRLHYLMSDYSPHVLGRARKAVAHHGDHVSSLVVEATHPSVSLGFLQGKAFLVYLSNVYDTLPGDEIARIGGRPYLVEVRAYLPGACARRIARSFSASGARLPDLVGKLLRLGPELLCEAFPQHFGALDQAVAFWREVWTALRLQERYVPLEGLDDYQLTPDLTGEQLRSQLEADGDIRMHVNNGALSSFAETLPLLHPFGRLQCHDLFLSEVAPVPDRLLRPGQVRRLGRELGQRPAAAPRRRPGRLRRRDRAVRAAAVGQRQDADRAGAGMTKAGQKALTARGLRPAAADHGDRVLLGARVARPAEERLLPAPDQPALPGRDPRDGHQGGRGGPGSGRAWTSSPTASCAATTTSTTCWPGSPGSRYRSAPRPTTSTTTTPSSAARCRRRGRARAWAWPATSGSCGSRPTCR